MNCCGNDCCKSPSNCIVDTSSKEGLLKRREEVKIRMHELEQMQNDLWQENRNLDTAYTELLKTELINRNIVGKCFVSNKKANEFECCRSEDDKSTHSEYYRVVEIKHFYNRTVTLLCDFFNKHEKENEKAFHFGNGVIEVVHEMLDEKNEVSIEEFKQKREEYFNEYKEYVQ